MQSLDDAYSIFFNAEGNATIYTTHPSNMLVHSVHRESISNHVKPKIYNTYIDIIYMDKIISAI